MLQHLLFCVRVTAWLVRLCEAALRTRMEKGKAGGKKGTNADRKKDHETRASLSNNTSLHVKTGGGAWPLQRHLLPNTLRACGPNYTASQPRQRRKSLKCNSLTLSGPLSVWAQTPSDFGPPQYVQLSHKNAVAAATWLTPFRCQFT
jgi:hypothetical protein